MSRTEIEAVGGVAEPDRADRISVPPMKLELQPPQPASVERAVELLLAQPARPEVDPWWRAGLAGALGEPDEREPAA